MKLQDLLESDLNISITITIKELKEFADYLLQQSKDDIERLILETKQPKEYLTPNETAKLLHVNRSTLYQCNKSANPCKPYTYLFSSICLIFEIRLVISSFKSPTVKSIRRVSSENLLSIPIIVLFIKL